MKHHLRVARPVTDLDGSREMYCRGLGLRVLGSFRDHEGFDGVMLGREGMDYHLELTRCGGHPVRPAPTEEDLLVFYIPDRQEWESACEAVLAAGFRRVTSFNPWWEKEGRTFEDGDGYRIVLQNSAWTSVER